MRVLSPPLHFHEHPSSAYMPQGAGSRTRSSHPNEAGSAKKLQNKGEGGNGVGGLRGEGERTGGVRRQRVDTVYNRAEELREGEVVDEEVQDEEERRQDAGEVRSARRLLSIRAPAARLHRCVQAPLQASWLGSPVPSTRPSSGGCLPVRCPPSRLPTSPLHARTHAHASETRARAHARWSSQISACQRSVPWTGLEVGC